MRRVFATFPWLLQDSFFLLFLLLENMHDSPTLQLSLRSYDSFGVEESFQPIDSAFLMHMAPQLINEREPQVAEWKRLVAHKVSFLSGSAQLVLVCGVYPADKFDANIPC